MSVQRLPTGLRSLLRSAIRNPGTLFQPILLEHAPPGRELRDELAAIAEEEGARLFTRFDQISDLGLSEKGVALLAAADVRNLPSTSVLGIPPGCQIVVWSTGMSGELSDDLKSWVERGLIYRASHRNATSPYDTFVSTIAHCLTRPGRIYNPVVLVTEAASIDRYVIESLLRLQARGIHVAEELAAPFNADHWGARQAPPQGSGLVVRMTGYDPAANNAADRAFMFALEQAQAVPVQVVLVMDRDTEARLERHDHWRDLISRGVLLKLQGDSEPKAGKRARLDAYPAIRLVMASKPPQASRTQTILEGSVSKVPLGDTLQFIAMSAPSGRLIVFTEHDVAFLDFSAGRIVHVGPSDRWVPVVDIAEARDVDFGDAQALGQLAEEVMENRVVEIGEWQDARYAYIARDAAPPMGESVSLDPQAVMLTIAQREDEWPQLSRKVGGVGRIWIRSGEAPESDTSDLGKRLWEVLDGSVTLGEASRRLGVSRFEVAAAVQDLFSANRITFVRDVPDEERIDEEAAATVIRTLWAEGLVDEAADVAADAARVHPESAVLAYYAGWVHTDRSEWEDAVREFRAANERAEGERAFAAAANAALIEVRHMSVDAVDALARVREIGLVDEILAGKAAYAAAACAELALRAEDYPLAARLLGHITNDSVRSDLESVLDRA